jgi:hypothetical protein
VGELFVKQLSKFSIFAKSEETTTHPGEHCAEWQIHLCGDFGERFAFVDTAVNDLLLIGRQVFEGFSDGLPDFFTDEQLFWFAVSVAGSSGWTVDQFCVD